MPKPPPSSPSPDAEPGGERIARAIARSGLCSRRDAERRIGEGRVTLNGKPVSTPALTVGPDDRIEVDGVPLPARERTRLWLFHKPKGVLTAARDPEGRRVLADMLPAELKTLHPVGRLDFNTEGLLLLTNDGALKRLLELPSTGWLRRYRVRAFGEAPDALLDRARAGMEIEGIRYGPMEVAIERQKGDNQWLTVALREGKNREVKVVLGALGLKVNRLIRVSYGPFQLGDLEPGALREIRGAVLRDQLSGRRFAAAGLDLDGPVRQPATPADGPKAKAGRPGRTDPSGKGSKAGTRVRRAGKPGTAERAGVGVRGPGVAGFVERPKERKAGGKPAGKMAERTTGKAAGKTAGNAAGKPGGRPAGRAGPKAPGRPAGKPAGRTPGGRGPR